MLAFGLVVRFAGRVTWMISSERSSQTIQTIAYNFQL